MKENNGQKPASKSPKTEPKTAAKPAATAPNTVSAEAIIADLQKKVDENLQLAKYHKAEFENYKRRHQDDAVRAFQDGQAYVTEMLLPVFDGVVEAEKKITDPAAVAGFNIIRKKLDDLFGKLGLEVIPTVGQPFDPNLHNAVAVEKVDGKEADEILEEWQKGFRFHGRVLRPAMVKVTGG